MACSGRKHTWQVNPPVAGTKCTKCPKVFAVQVIRGADAQAALQNLGDIARSVNDTRRAASLDSAAAAAAGAPRVNPLAAALARVAPAAAPPAAAALPEPPPEARGWTKFAGPRLAHVFVTVTGAALERAKRRANEPDDEDVDELGAALAEQLTVWFPESSLSPGKRCLIAALAVAGEMAIGAQKITSADDVEPKQLPQPAPAAGTFTPPAAAAVKQERQPKAAAPMATPAGAFGDF